MNRRTINSPISKFFLISLIALTGLTLAACSIFKSEDEETTYDAGVTYFGRNDYIEYTGGDLPIIITVPHGGTLEPEEIPSRQYSSIVPMPMTQELTRALASALNSRLGGNVHLVVNHLKRSRLDANHTLMQGAEGNEFAEIAWNEYHDFIKAARKKVLKTWEAGLYLDVHSHADTLQYVQLGYLIDGGLFKMSDTNLNDWELRDISSIRMLAKEATARFVDLLRGEMSLGTLLGDAGYPSVPSTQIPDPGLNPYNSGDWCVKWYGSKWGDRVDAIQLTVNWTGILDSTENVNAFAAALAEILENYIETHYEYDLQTGPF